MGAYESRRLYEAGGETPEQATRNLELLLQTYCPALNVEVREYVHARTLRRAPLMRRSECVVYPTECNVDPVPVVFKRQPFNGLINASVALW